MPPEDRRYVFGEPEEVGMAPEIREMGPAAPAEAAEGSAEGIQEPHLAGTYPQENKEVSLCEALDRILHKGAMLYGEVMISVADIDLVYLGLQVILSSMETARGFKPLLVDGQLGPNLLDKRAS